MAMVDLDPSACCPFPSHSFSSYSCTCQFISILCLSLPLSTWKRICSAVTLNASSSKVIFRPVLLSHPQLRNIGNSLLFSVGKPASQVGRSEARRLCPPGRRTELKPHSEAVSHCVLSTEEIGPLPSPRTTASSLSGQFSLIGSQCSLFSFTSGPATLSSYYSVWLCT